MLAFYNITDLINTIKSRYRVPDVAALSATPSDCKFNVILCIIVFVRTSVHKILSRQFSIFKQAEQLLHGYLEIVEDAKPSLQKKKILITGSAWRTREGPSQIELHCV